MTTYERIKEASKRRGMSLQTLAEKAGLGINSIYKWKTSTPKADALVKVAEVLDVSIDYLLGQEDKTSSIKTVDIEDDDVIMTFEGKEIPPEDIELMERLLRGKRNE